MLFDNYPPVSGGLRWLYVDFNSYFASVEQQLDPRLRGKPVIVVPVMTDSTCAIAASYEAKAYGIRTNTPVYEAKRLCPHIICVTGGHENYVAFHQRILDEIDRHIPVTAVCSIDEMACRLMDNEVSVARATDIAAAIKDGIRRNIGAYVRCSIGLAPNKYLAKIATDMQKPDGLTILTSSNLMTRLRELNLRDLPGVGANMERRINMAGIYDMDALLKLDAKRMRAVWGNIWGERLWYLLRGVELQDEDAPDRKSIGHSHVMGPELRDPEKTRMVGRRLTMKCAARLRRMAYYASAMSVSVRSEGGMRFAAERRFYRAQDSFTFLEAFEDAWTEIRRSSGRLRLKKASVTFYGLMPADALQDDLFTAISEDLLQKRGKMEKISQAIDKLNHKYGRDTVVPGMLPHEGRSFTGTKVAFTRIPDAEEFLE